MKHSLEVNSNGGIILTDGGSCFLAGVGGGPFLRLTKSFCHGGAELASSPVNSAADGGLVTTGDFAGFSTSSDVVPVDCRDELVGLLQLNGF